MLRPALFIFLLALLPLAAVAQEEDASPAGAETSPRELFEAASEALRRGDSAEAVRLFRASLAAEERGSTAWALAVTLQEAGQVSEALRFYDRLLAGEFGELPVDAADVTEVRNAAIAAQGELTVRVASISEVRVLVDGEPLGSVAPGGSLTFRVDPGQHMVRGLNVANESTTRTVQVASGATAHVDLVIESRPAEAAPVAGPLRDAPEETNTVTTTPEDEARRRRRRRLGIGLGLTLLAAAGAAVAIGLAASKDQGGALVESPFESAMALRRR